MINWKERYETLAKLTSEFQQRLREAEWIHTRINNHIVESDRIDLYDRNKCHLMRLTQDVTIAVEYQDGPRDQKTYPAGTLIECSKNGHVYLDDDGDGELHFPPAFLQQVELDRDSVDWDNVIQQG